MDTYKVPAGQENSSASQDRNPAAVRLVLSLFSLGLYQSSFSDRFAELERSFPKSESRGKQRELQDIKNAAGIICLQHELEQHRMD